MLASSTMLRFEPCNPIAAKHNVPSSHRKLDSTWPVLGEVRHLGESCCRASVWALDLESGATNYGSLVAKLNTSGVPLLQRAVVRLTATWLPRELIPESGCPLHYNLPERASASSAALTHSDVLRRIFVTSARPPTIRRCPLGTVRWRALAAALAKAPSHQQVTMSHCFSTLPLCMPTRPLPRTDQALHRCKRPQTRTDLP